jgi:hypothetical protein
MTNMKWKAGEIIATVMVLLAPSHIEKNDVTQ